MTDVNVTANHTHTAATDWGIPILMAVCEQCDADFILPPNTDPPHCPNCFQEALTPFTPEVTHMAYYHPPELRLPFILKKTGIIDNISEFAKQIRFTPNDLTPNNLIDRMQPVYLPRWLVDGDTTATWIAEVGFNYDVVTHQDRYSENKGAWVSNELNETRIRWEPRAGRLTRTYHNINAPAMDNSEQIKARLGQFSMESAQPYQADDLAGTLVRLPDRAPGDAWSDAEPHFQDAATDECRQAAEADHIRDFRWAPEFQKLNWTQLLMPIYSTYYLDDDQQPHIILIHGQTGQVHGSRRASMKQAKRLALIIFGIAAFIGFLSLIIFLAGLALESVLQVVAVLGLLLAVIIALSALIPIFMAWDYNRTQTSLGAQ